MYVAMYVYNYVYVLCICMYMHTHVSYVCIVCMHVSTSTCNLLFCSTHTCKGYYTIKVAIRMSSSMFALSSASYFT